MEFCASRTGNGLALITCLAKRRLTQDLLDTLYLDDETLAWAKAASFEDEVAEVEKVVHKNSNGTRLQSGDSAVLVKDLDVKGAGFTERALNKINSD